MAPRRRRLVAAGRAVPDGERRLRLPARRRRDAAARPAVRRQPDGVHGPRRTFDPRRSGWTDGGWTAASWPGRSIYELHVGTFTPEGTLDAAIERLDHLVELGVDHVELMPVNAFNGDHNWGYDGVAWYAVHEPYGGPARYQAVRRRLPRRGLGVVLDVVYNHLGPSGNYLPRFGPVPHRRGRNTWGDAGQPRRPGCDEVRRYILDNALMWLRDYHVDGLRLDAVHALVDDSRDRTCSRSWRSRSSALAAHARPAAVADRRVRPERPAADHPARGRRLRPDAQWSDDFHHALHVALTGETDGYYADFGSLAGAGQGARRAAFFHDGTLLVVPRPRPRRADRHRGDCRPGGSSSTCRTTTRSATGRPATG